MSSWTRQGHALDVIVLAADSSYGSSDFHVVFDAFPSDEALVVEIQVNQCTLPRSFLSMRSPKYTQSSAVFKIASWVFVQGGSTKPNPDVFQSLVEEGLLGFGRNHIRFQLVKAKSNVILCFADAFIFLWPISDRFIISDIDGTITKSNAIGVWDSILTRRYRHVHEGMCRFFSHILSSSSSSCSKQGGSTLRIIYLSSRPSFLIDTTRHFIQSLQQQGSSYTHDECIHGLPDGPILLQPTSLWTALAGEVIHKNSFIFKANALRSYIIQPFLTAASKENAHEKTIAPCLFAAAFGNTECDYMAYRQLGIMGSKIYIIDEKSVLCSWEETGQSSFITEDDEKMHTEMKTGSGIFHACIGKRWYSHRPPSKYITVAQYQGYHDPKLIDDILHHNDRQIDQPT